MSSFANSATRSGWRRSGSPSTAVARTMKPTSSASRSGTVRRRHVRSTSPKGAWSQWRGACERAPGKTTARNAAASRWWRDESGSSLRRPRAQPGRWCRSRPRSLESMPDRNCRDAPILRSSTQEIVDRQRAGVPPLADAEVAAVRDHTQTCMQAPRVLEGVVERELHVLRSPQHQDRAPHVFELLTRIVYAERLPRTVDVGVQEVGGEEALDRLVRQ